MRAFEARGFPGSQWIWFHMISAKAPHCGHGTSNTRMSLSAYARRTWLVSSNSGVEPMMIFRLLKLNVRRSDRRIGLPSAPVSHASASSTTKTRAVCRLRFRGALAATTFREPPGKRRDSRVFPVLAVFVIGRQCAP